MTSTGTCPQCGTLLFSETAAGLCPKCLGALGFAGAAGEATSPVTPPRLPRIGDYELIEEIARGGMGVVYKARQLSLGRIVAVKVVLHGPFSSPEFVRRFQTEAAAVAALQHPHIVAIFEVGEQAGDHFFSMEFIEGQSLAETVREKPLPARRAATYLKTIAEAVHYAHQRGVLHRDLKPSNVLLDIFDQPRITDFGLAKLQDSEVELTRTGQVLGSPSYISPEQAAGKNSAAGPEGDIYSLGTILYHLLTGRPPFQGETVQEVLLQVQNAEPVAPRRLNASVPVDLQTICLKCLRKEPAKRYTSALELAEDLARFLANEPIQARPIGAIGRLALWCRRKPALATSLGVGCALLLTVAIGSPIAALRIDRARRAAETAHRQEVVSRARAESAERQAQQQLFAALVGQARATLRNGEAGQRFAALDALRRATVISNAVELRREIFAALSLPDMRPERRLPYAEDYTLRRLDPTFQRVALCRRTGPVEIRAIADGALRATLPASTNLEAHLAIWSRDGRYLAVKRDRDGPGYFAEWEVWDVNGARIILIIHDAIMDAVEFHPDGKSIVAGVKQKGVAVWDLRDGRPTTFLALPDDPFRLAFDPGGNRFAVSQRTVEGSLISVHDAATGAMQASHLSSERVMQLQWHPRGVWLAFSQSSGAVNLLNPVSGEVAALGRHKATAVDLEFTPTGDYLVSSGWDNELSCWDVSARRRAFVMTADGFPAQLSADGRACVVKTATGLQWYEFAPPTGFREFSEDLGGRVNHAAFSKDGQWLAASGLRLVGVWDMMRRGPGALLNPGDEVKLAFSSSNELFLSNHDICSRWRVTGGSEDPGAPVLERLPIASPPGLVSLCLASNGVVVTGAQGSQWMALNPPVSQPGQWTRTIAGVNGLSPDEHWLGMFGPFTTEFYAYRFPEIEPAARLNCAANIADFAFSPQGDEVAIGSDRQVEFWSTSSWKKTRSLTNFTGVVYSPDGRTGWLWTVNRGGGLFRIGTMEALLPFPASMRPLAVSPDGRHLAVSVDAQRLQVWDIAEVRRQLRELGMDWAN